MNEIALIIHSRRNRMVRIALTPSNSARLTKETNKMKTLIKLSLILSALTLGACGDAVYETSNIDVPSVEIQQPVTVVTPQPLPEPTAIAPSPVLNPPVVITVCPQGTTGQCGNSPATLPPNRNPVIVTNPEPVCIRNNEPLVMVNGLLTDNCGNKYGVVTF